jgi:hypothetical protein
MWLGEELLVRIIWSAYELEFKGRERILWAEVWSYTEDEFYWPIARQSLENANFCINT